MGGARIRKLEGVYGSELQNKLQSAAKMIHELDAKQPGLKAFLKNRGIGDAAPVVALLVQQPERYHVRKGRS